MVAFVAQQIGADLGVLAEYGRREEERGRTQGAQRRLTGRAGYERT
jgi:hypothetical protein